MRFEATREQVRATCLALARISGDREVLLEELRRDGLRVLQDDHPLAVAHREIRRARSDSVG